MLRTKKRKKRDLLEKGKMHGDKRAEREEDRTGKDRSTGHQANFSPQRVCRRTRKGDGSNGPKTLGGGPYRSQTEKPSWHRRRRELKGAGLRPGGVVEGER